MTLRKGKKGRRDGKMIELGHYSRIILREMNRVIPSGNWLGKIVSLTIWKKMRCMDWHLVVREF